MSSFAFLHRYDPQGIFSYHTYEFYFGAADIALQDPDIAFFIQRFDDPGSFDVMFDLIQA
jgi:hypothetical protein